jgi:hypothetical protein
VGDNQILSDFSAAENSNKFPKKPGFWTGN